MTHLRKILLIVLFGALASTAGHANALTLRADIVATGKVVTLGDFFRDAGRHAGTALFKAPAAGQSGFVSTERLSSAVSRHGLSWTPPLGLHQISVLGLHTEAVGQDVMRSLTDLLVADLAGSLPQIRSVDDLEVELDRGAGIVAVPGTGIDDLRVTRLDIEPGRKRFSARIELARGPAQIISGRYVQTTSIPVLARNVARGTIVTGDMIAWQRLRADASADRMLLAENAIVGQAARRTLRAGAPLRPGDLEAPKVIRRNQVVTIRFAVPGMRLTTQGRALADAAVGATVPVINARSNRVVQAIAYGEGLVEVGLQPTRIAAR